MILLNDLSLKYQDIATQLGCTREYVRQLDMHFSRNTGQQRRVARKVERYKQRWESVPFYRAAIERGLDVAFTEHHTELLVNGHSCKLVTGFWRKINGNRYAGINRPNSTCEVFVWNLMDTGKFLIMPSDAANFSQTAFAMEEQHDSNRKGAYCAQHNYREYIEAWGIFQYEACAIA